ncbi:uncharacterized protein [Leptinotarsa decemlineata]|uniref:uncharacterized protein n=1 Tax=Leptinotarsa decemlineata TaxID=7539 RepID=UPI003D30BB4F
MNWREMKNFFVFRQVYFEDLAKTSKPSSIWAIYSMLRKTLNVKKNLDISKYSKLRASLKHKSDGYKSKKSSTLTSEQINQFIKEAPDSKYLFSKVAVIIAISGACRKTELKDMQIDHIKDMDKELYIKVPDTKTKTEKSFIVSDNFIILQEPENKNVDKYHFFSLSKWEMLWSGC